MELSTKQAIKTDKLPKAIGPYSPAVVFGNVFVSSGQLPIDPSTGKLVSADIAEQTRQALDNLLALLDAAGKTPHHVLKTTIYLVYISDFPKVNSVYAEYFREPFPSRTTVGVSALPLGALIEIEAFAA